MNKKSVLVTGSSRGIGRACAIAFAKAGYHVFINCRQNIALLHSLQDEILSCGGTCTLLPGDVGDPSQVKSMFCQIEKETGGIDILVNNAGLTRDNLFIRMSDEDWQLVLDVNLSAGFKLAKAAVRGMMKRRFGRIIGIASVVGVTGNAGQANYAASKAGIIGLTKSAAKELASRGITVNAIAPGFIKTDMTDVLSDKVKENIAASIPMGSMGTTEDVAKAAVFLASDGARYITGQILRVDGGMAM